VTTLDELTAADAGVLVRLGIDGHDANGTTPGLWDNKPTWDNWNRKNWSDFNRWSRYPPKGK
jgi:hypothetical protein